MTPTSTEPQKTVLGSAAHSSQTKHTGGGQGRETERQGRGLEEGREGEREERDSPSIFSKDI